MIGQYIRDERQKQNISLKALALEVGVTSSALSQIEKGKRSPKIQTLLKITDALHISPNDVLGKNISVTTHHTNYTIYLTKKELEILNEIKKHEKLYKLLSSPRGKKIIEVWAKKIS